MKTYIADIIPKIQRFSQKLDNLTLLTEQHWVVIDNEMINKNVYIFRSDGTLLIAQNGIVTKAKWEYLGNNSLLIDKKDQSYLYKHGFFDENILALKIDGKDEYAFLINENKFDQDINSIDRVLLFLKEKYIDSTIRKELNIQSSIDTSHEEENYPYSAPSYVKKIIGEEHTLIFGSAIKIEISFEDKVVGEFFSRKRKVEFYFKEHAKNRIGSIFHFYNTEINCINALHYYLTTNHFIYYGYNGSFS